MSRRKPRLNEIAPKLHQIYAYFWPQIAKHKSKIVWSFMALLASVVFRLLEPWPLKVFLDLILASSPDSSAIGWLPPMSDSTLLAGIAISIVVIAVASAFCDYYSRVGFFVVGNKVVIHVRDRLYRHLQRLSLAYHRRSRTGDLIIRVTRDVSLIRDVTATAMLPMIASTAVLIGMVMVMFLICWELACLAIFAVPIFWITTRRIGRRIRATAKRQREREGAMATTAAESLHAIAMIKAMQLEERFAQSFGQRNSQSQKSDLKASRLSVRMARAIDILLAITSAFVIWLGGRMVLEGRMTAGDIVVFLTYLKRAFKPAQEFAKYTARLAKAAAAGERVIEVLETPIDVVDAKHPICLDTMQGEVTLEDVQFAYHASQPVLTGIDFRIDPGELVCFVGPSGGGKSTLCSLILRLADPQHGRVLIDGHDVRELEIESMRRRMSCVMQDPLLIADTIYENIACARPDATDEEVRRAAAVANADEFIDRFTDRYETKVGEQGATLSRGQQQRLAIARAAIRHPSLLLLDEPTTGLDEESEQIVMDALLRLAKGCTTIMVTHNLALAARSDRILFLDGGTIVEQGSHAELIAKQARYAKWFRQQQSKLRRAATTSLSVVS